MLRYLSGILEDQATRKSLSQGNGTGADDGTDLWDSDVDRSRSRYDHPGPL